MGVIQGWQVLRGTCVFIFLFFIGIHGFGAGRKSIRDSAEEERAQWRQRDLGESRFRISHGEKNLRIMTFNLHGVPVPGRDTTTFEDIGKILKRRIDEKNAPDIVTLQEAFRPKTKNVVKFAQYPYVAWGPKRRFLKTGSGLVVLSKYPIMVNDAALYSQCASWDCLARKGVQFVAINVDGIPVPVQVFNTHMNGGVEKDPFTTDERTRDVRLSQVKEFYNFVQKRQNISFPTLFMGDFNIRAADREYKTFMAFLNIINFGEYCAEDIYCMGSEVAKGWPKFVDHVFYDPSNQYQFTVMRYARNMGEIVNGRRLSDHFAVEMDIKVEW